MSGAVVNLDEATGPPCCGSHHPGGDDRGRALCCDPEDCGPCCPNCPTCPAVARDVARGPSVQPGVLDRATVHTLRAMTAAYATGVMPEARIEAASAALSALAELQRRDEQSSALIDALSALCPCDSNPATTDGPQRECPVHGDPDVAVELLRLGAEFRTQVFDQRAWEAGRTWSRSVLAGRETPPAQEAVAAQDRHYVRQVARYGELLSRMMGRLVGYREAVAELTGQGDEGRAAWRRRA